MTKIQMKEISITRSEGPSDHNLTSVPCGKTFTVGTWSEANWLLCQIAADKRRLGDTRGYDKTDFTVIWEDGMRYDGRADVKSDGDDTDLGQHIQEFIAFLTGTYRPSHLSDDDWNRICREYESDGRAAEAREFLETYHVPERSWISQGWEARA